MPVMLEWHKFPDEKPPDAGFYLTVIYDDTVGKHHFLPCVSHYWPPTDGMAGREWTCGTQAYVTHWAEVPALPAEIGETDVPVG